MFGSVRRRRLKSYGLGNLGHLYTIDAATGSATKVSAPFAPLLNGTEFSMDFNPVTDGLTVISNLGQSLSVNPDTGQATINPNVGNVLGPHFSGIAYSNNSPGAASTTLYGFSNRDPFGLFTINPATGGVTFVPGWTGYVSDDLGGFDIWGGTLGFVVVTDIAENYSSLIRIDLLAPFSTITELGAIGAPLPFPGFPGPAASLVRDVAIPIPSPGAAVCLAVPAIFAAHRRRVPARSS